MLTALQQIASSSLLLAFGVLALRVWRRLGTVRRDPAALAWGVTAAAFLTVGAYATAHSLLAAAAIDAGKGSWIWDLVSAWALACNVARSLVMVVFGAVLLALLVAHRRAGPRIARLAPAIFVAAAVGGTLGARLLLTDNTVYRFASTLAVLNAATAVVLMAALLAAVQNDGVDQLLWLALGVYALKETVSVSLLAVIAWWGLADVGTYNLIFWWVQVTLAGISVGLATRRLRLATGGRRVPALFERLPEPRRAVHG